MKGATKEELFDDEKRRAIAQDLSDFIERVAPFEIHIDSNGLITVDVEDELSELA